jgi:hypothetical protein
LHRRVGPGHHVARYSSDPFLATRPRYDDLFDRGAPESASGVELERRVVASMILTYRAVTNSKVNPVPSSSCDSAADGASLNARPERTVSACPGQSRFMPVAVPNAVSAPTRFWAGMSECNRGVRGGGYRGMRRGA